MSAVRALACGLLLWTGAAAAEPAEPPPPDYAAAEYVDSAGCVFQRVDIGSRAIWGARLGADGQPVCGIAPSVAPPGLSDALPEVPPNRRNRAPAFPEPGNYVQVGAFGQRGNADKVVQRLQLRQLPVLRQDFPRGRGILRVLFAGPFPDADTTREALETVREMGFGDAFVWQQQP
jgi:hypothetical protein